MTTVTIFTNIFCSILNKNWKKKQGDWKYYLYLLHFCRLLLFNIYWCWSQTREQMTTARWGISVLYKSIWSRTFSKTYSYEKNSCFKNFLKNVEITIILRHIGCRARLYYKDMNSLYYQLNRLGLGLSWASTFMDCMFDTNNKKGQGVTHFILNP